MVEIIDEYKKFTIKKFLKFSKYIKNQQKDKEKMKISPIQMLK